MAGLKSIDVIISNQMKKITNLASIIENVQKRRSEFFGRGRSI